MVDPARGAFDFPEVSYRSFIQYNVALAVGPFGAIFLVAEGGSVAQGAENRVYLLAVVDLAFEFDSGFVASGLGFGFGLVSQNPLLSVLAKAEEFSFLAEFLAGEVVEGVYFVGGGSELLESCALQGAND